MNSTMETEKTTEGMGMKIPHIKFTSLRPDQLSELGAILNFCREHKLPPPERYAMYGSIDDRVMSVAIPNVMFDQIDDIEQYNQLCKEFGVENVDKLVIKNHHVLRARIHDILVHATDDVFKTNRLDVVLQVEGDVAATYTDKIVIEVLEDHYLQDGHRRANESFEDDPSGPYVIYRVTKGRE